MEDESTKEILSYIKREIPMIKKVIGWIAEWQLQSRAQLNLLLSLFSSTMIGVAIGALGIVIGSISLITVVIQNDNLTLSLGITMFILGIATLVISIVLACWLKKSEQKFLDEVPKLEELSKKLNALLKEGTDS